MAVQKYVKRLEYYFMASGAQGILWPNAIVFVAGHALYIASLHYLVSLVSSLSLLTLCWSMYPRV